MERGKKEAKKKSGPSNLVYKYQVTVKLGDNSIIFDFFSSINDFQNGVKEMGENGLGFALYCFISDAISGVMDIEDFESDFGYTKASECIKAWQACQKQYQKAQSLGLSENDLYDLANELSEKYG